MKSKIKINQSFLVTMIAILLGLIMGGILMALMGSNPIDGYIYLFKGGLMSVERIGNTLATATTLMLAGLSVAFAFKTGLFNIGVSGQMLVGGLAATALALSLDFPKIILLPICVTAAILAGAFWGLIPGLLKAKFNVHEVVATIMMNWIAYWTVYYTIKTWFTGGMETESRAIPMAASLKVGALTSFFNGSYINLGIFIAIGAAILVAFILNKTVLGYELKAAGYNKFGAEYAGMKVNRNIALSMAIAGAISGLAGATFYLGYAVNMQVGILPSQGFDGIAVALLVNNNPYGVIASSIFFGILQSGKGFMNAMTSIPPELADTIIAFIIYFAATSVLITNLWSYFKRKKSRKEQAEKLATAAGEVE